MSQAGRDKVSTAGQRTAHVVRCLWLLRAARHGRLRRPARPAGAVSLLAGVFLWPRFEQVPSTGRPHPHAVPSLP
jgi:hypothetical protein